MSHDASLTVRISIEFPDIPNMEIARLVLEYWKTIIWPGAVLVIVVVFRQEISALLTRLKRARLPGGISIETFPQQLRLAKELSFKVREEKYAPTPERIRFKKSAEAKIQVPLPFGTQKERPSIPLTEANVRMLNLGLAPSPSGLELSYYRILAEQDPILALAGLRIETETMLRNIARGFHIPASERDGAGTVAGKLREHGSITYHQFQLIRAILDLCNAAIHGHKVTLEQAQEVLDVAQVLRDQYLSWLTWGFPEHPEP